ncbi:MAG: copper chaperone PCu(A)C [Acidiferrobacterales bacterium]
MTYARICMLAVVGLSAGAIAHDYKAGHIQVAHPWSRALPEVARNGAAYMVLSNNGASSDRLLSAASPIAKRAELHTHTMKGGVMKMRPIDAIEVAPGTPSVLAPGGLHIMLVGLKEPLVAGKEFPLELHFERAGRLTVRVTVQETGPSHHKRHAQ